MTRRARKGERSVVSDGRTWLSDRCWACGHIFAFMASHCPQCNKPQGRKQIVAWTCQCPRCREARAWERVDA